MKWRESVGGCENLQGKLRGTGGGGGDESNTNSEWRDR